MEKVDQIWNFFKHKIQTIYKDFVLAFQCIIEKKNHKIR